MALEAVQNTKNNNFANTGYWEAASFGAVCGYSLKYLMPVATQEKDENYTNALKEVNLKAKKAKLAEINNIRKSKFNSDATDTFIRMYDAKKLTPTKIRKIKESLREDLINVIRNVNEVARDKKINGKKDIDAITKNIRPTGVFVIGGLIVGLSIAIINNVTKKINEYNSQKN